MKRNLATIGGTVKAVKTMNGVTFAKIATMPDGKGIVSVKGFGFQAEALAKLAEGSPVVVEAKVANNQTEAGNEKEVVATGVHAGKDVLYLNKVELIGRLTAEPKYFAQKSEQGTAMCSYGVALDDGYYDKAKKWVGRVVYADVRSFALNAEEAKKLDKGSLVFVEGTWRTTSYKNKDGKDVWTNVVVAKEQIAAEKVASAPAAQTKAAAPAEADADDGFTGFMDEAALLNPFNQ